MVHRYTNWEISKRLFKTARPIFKKLVISILASIFGNLAHMGFMGFGALWILAKSGQLPFTYFYPLMTLVSALCIAIGRYLEGIFSHLGAYSILAKLRVQFFSTLEKLSPAIFVEQKIGDLLNLAIADIETLEYFYAHTIGPIVTVIVLPIVSLLVAYHYALIYVWVLIPIYLFVIVFIPLFSFKIGQGIGTQLRSSLGQLKSLLVEIVYGLKDIQIFHNQEQKMQVLKQRNEEINHSQHKLAVFRQLLSSIPNFFVYLARIALVYSSLSLFANKENQVGIIVVSFVTGASFSSSFSLTFVITHLVEAYASARRLFKLMDKNLYVKENNKAMQLNKIETIELKDVCFHYPKDDKDIMHQVNLCIHRGEKIGIIGESGSGKSTLLRLIMRFYDVDKGKILINGKDIKNYAIADLHKYISLLEQDTYLFDLSLRDNLRLAKQTASEQEIWQALKLAGIDSFVRNLAQGLDTAMGEMSARVSGGERQRIGLARTILRNPDVLILDEPSANLDTLHELELLQTIKKAYNDKTVIIISHRYSTLANCDHIYEVKNNGINLRK